MKVQKITLIAQAVGMYVMGIPLYIFFITQMIPVDNEALANGLLKAAGILASIVSPVIIVNIVLSIVSLAKGEVDLSKTVMVVKLVLIPWYILNFAMGFILVGVMFNPFMMIGIPVVVTLLMSNAYFCLLGTSLPDVALYIRNARLKKGKKKNGALVLVVFLLFIFCLDVVAGIILYLQNKNEALTPTPEEPISESE